MLVQSTMIGYLAILTVSYIVISSYSDGLLYFKGNTNYTAILYFGRVPIILPRDGRS